MELSPAFTPRVSHSSLKNAVGGWWQGDQTSQAVLCHSQCLVTAVLLEKRPELDRVRGCAGADCGSWLGRGPAPSFTQETAS